MSVESIGYRVLESALSRERLVLQGSAILVDERVESLLVLLDVSEVEVVHLEHCLHILRCAASADILVEVSQRQVHVGVLAGEYLLQLCAAEVSESAVAYHVVEQVEVNSLLCVVERLTTLGRTAEQYLTLFQVSLLQQYACTIAQCQLLVSELGILLLRNDLASLWLLCDERLLLNVVYVSLDLLCAGIVVSLLQACLCRVYHTFLLSCGVVDYNVRVAEADELLHSLVYHIYR